MSNFRTTGDELEPALSEVHAVSERRLPPTLGLLAESLHYGRTRIGLALLLAVVGFALIGPYFAPYSPTEFVGLPYSGRTASAKFGADYLGQDVLSRVLWGGRSILWMSFAATTLGVAVGVALGLIAGYARNWLDDVIMRLLEFQYAFPSIVFVLLFASLLGRHSWLIVTLVALAYVPGIARVTRGMTLEVASREFVEAAEVLGVPRRRILRREVLPNLTTPLSVEYSLRLTWAIGTIAAISFLGFGTQAPNTDWGLMINENRNGLTIQPWAIVLPISCIALFTISTNLIAEGIGYRIAGVDRQVKDA